MVSRRLVAVGVGGVLCLLAAGCGGETPVVQVTGTATRQGKALANLAIYFSPDKGMRSVALTDKEGKFTMIQSDGRQGVRVGTHRVWVQIPSPGARSDEERRQRLTGRETDPDIGKLLEKYGKSETTPLVLEITTDRDIDLKLD